MRREDFPILTEKVHGRELVYLDNAATTQKPQVVLDAIMEGYSKWNANVHRGVHHLSQVATEKHEQARKKVAEWLNAVAEEVIFTKGTTDSINMLARSFGDAIVNERDEIIVSQLEHHSNIVPWQMLCERKKAVLKVIPLREDLSIDIEAYNEEAVRALKVYQDLSDYFAIDSGDVEYDSVIREFMLRLDCLNLYLICLMVCSLMNCDGDFPVTLFTIVLRCLFV